MVYTLENLLRNSELFHAPRESNLECSSIQETAATGSERVNTITYYDDFFLQEARTIFHFLNVADDKYSVGRTMDIQMDIKPRSSSGLLLAIHGRNDHVILEMVNGTIKFLVKAAKGQIETSYEATSPNALCDGNWHNIRGKV